MADGRRRDAMRDALLAGDFEAFAESAGTEITREQFDAASDVWRSVEMMMLCSELAPDQAERLEKMAEIARYADTQDAKIERLVSWCEALIAAGLTDAPQRDEACRNLQRLAPQLASLDACWMGARLEEEIAKPIPGAAVLASAFLERAGFRGRGGKALDNKAISAAVSRVRRGKR